MPDPDVFAITFYPPKPGHVISAAKALKEAVVRDMSLSEAMDLVRSGTIEVGNGQAEKVVRALTPFVSFTGPLPFPQSYEDAMARLGTVARRLAARIVQKAADALESFENRL